MADLGSLLGAAGIGGAIGQAIVRLELDTTKYNAELKGAQAQTVASTNASSSAFSSFGSIASKALLGVGVAAVAGAAFSIKAAIEANEAHLKLQNTFENNERLSDSSVGAFERQADALRELTGADDEAIVGAQALLGQFRLTGAQVQQLTPLIVDLSSKMGIELEAAAKAVGKATQGSTGALARYGIQIDTTDKSASTFTQTVEGLGVVQGFAAERADAEPWRLLAAQFEEIAEQLGEKLLPILQDVAEILGAPVEQDVGKAIIQLSDDIDYFKPRAEAYQRQLDEMAQKADLAAAGQYNLSGGIASTIVPSIKSTAAMKRQREALEELVEEGAKNITSALGDLSSFEKGWELTSRGAVNAMEGMAKQAQRMARDFKALDKEAIPQALKDFLIKEGPDAVDAFVHGTEKQKNRFQAAWRTFESAQKSSIDAMEKAARPAGTAMVQGIIQGVESGRGQLAATMASIVRQAIQAARDAAGSASPSKRMHELGVDMMVGLANGISDAEQKAIDAARKALEKTIDEVSSALDKIKGKASSFRDTIRGAFGEFADIGGAFGSAEESTPLSAVIASQVGGATVLADVLEALKRQGASKGLLSQVAESGTAFGQALLAGGPEQVAEANAALKTIAELSQQTGKALSESFFGDRIDKVEKRLEQIHDDLRELNALEREGQRIDVILDNEKVGEGVRKQLIRTGSRNPDIFGGRA